MLLLSASNQLVAPSYNYLYTLYMYITFREMQFGQAICLVKQKNAYVQIPEQHLFTQAIISRGAICCENDHIRLMRKEYISYPQCGFAKLSLN